ncbi:MAG: hypothetical protein P1U88_08825 [Thalassobaculaceae bacterium]|nr:hypothetical protein [Thalassobaculaceae bacterium]
MSVTEATTQANPSWWGQSAGPSGEADPASADTGGSDDSFGFGDLLDVLNPLQHIPVVSTLYRELTGDTISETARMTGGALWGGPAGLIGALANTITERETGADIGATALAYVQGDDTGSGDPLQDATVMAAAPAPQGSGSDPASLLGPPSDAIARFAAAEPAVTSVSTAPGMIAAAPQGSAQSQEFSGSAASRLDAFIQSANAVRTPALAPARGPAQGLAVSRPNPGMTASATALKPAQPPAEQAVAKAPQAESAAPLKLATDGNTDVANWMMRALDRYETMKSHEQS